VQIASKAARTGFGLGVRAAEGRGGSERGGLPRSATPIENTLSNQTIQPGRHSGEGSTIGDPARGQHCDRVSERGPRRAGFSTRNPSAATLPRWQIWQH
jgi:hypothetical protein